MNIKQFLKPSNKKITIFIIILSFIFFINIMITMDVFSWENSMRLREFIFSNFICILLIFYPFSIFQIFLSGDLKIEGGYFFTLLFTCISFLAIFLWYLIVCSFFYIYNKFKKKSK